MSLESPCFSESGIVRRGSGSIGRPGFKMEPSPETLFGETIRAVPRWLRVFLHELGSAPAVSDVPHPVLGSSEACLPMWGIHRNVPPRLDEIWRTQDLRSSMYIYQVVAICCCCRSYRTGEVAAVTDPRKDVSECRSPGDTFYICGSKRSGMGYLRLRSRPGSGPEV